MTRIYNAEQGFKDEFLEGLTAAYGRYLRRVPGASAVMAVDAPMPGQVSVIIGGGSGHYPAFAGLVGPGLCHGAVVGDVFTSPSADAGVSCHQGARRRGGRAALVRQLQRRRDAFRPGRGAGAGRRHRRAHRAGHRRRGQRARSDRRRDRRGIAGRFFVFRAAAAAARRGEDLAGVERVARHANGRTRTFGVAFAGCTFPGRTEPLFRVEPGTIALGLGIHGEPGIETVDWMPAEALADVLLAPLLRRAAGRRAPCPGAAERSRQHQVRRDVRALPVAPPAARAGRRGGRGARGRRVRHLPGHGRLLADPVLARRRAGAAPGDAGRDPRLPHGRRAAWTPSARCRRARGVRRRTPAAHPSAVARAVVGRTRCRRGGHRRRRGGARPARCGGR